MIASGFGMILQWGEYIDKIITKYRVIRGVLKIQKRKVIYDV